MAAFPKSAITLLGAEAVRRYYDWLFVGPHDGVAVGTFEGDRLIGILFAGIYRGALTGYIKKNMMFLFTRLLRQPALLFHEDIRDDLRLGIRLVLPKALRPPAAPAQPSSLPDKRFFGSLSLAVHPEYRGLAAIQMIREIERIAQEHGYDGVRLTTHPSNVTTTRLYTMLGYEKVMHGEVWTGGLFRVF